jgi:predicted ATPase
MPRLIEREGLLARLADAQRAGGRLLLVGGEAGVGKTTLVRAFTSGVQGRVLLGACERLVTPAPLGPLVDVAGQVGGALASDIEAGWHPRQVALSLLDELRQPGGARLRGRALGRRGDARRGARPGSSRRRDALAGGRHVPRGRGGR